MVQPSIFAKRTNWSLSTNELVSTFLALKKESGVIDLTQSNPTHCQFQYPHDLILNPFNTERNLNYQPEAFGRTQAREAVCQYYKSKGFDIDVRRILLTASTSEAYSFLFRLLTNVGEGIMFPSPSYPLFQYLVDLNDVFMDVYPLVYNAGWSVDMEGVKSCLHDDTRVIVLVNPNNPTGSFIKRDELNNLNDICIKKNLALISDEVFWDFPVEQSDSRISCMNNDKVLTFVLGGISKTLGLPQMKLSWIVVSGPDELTNQALARLEVIADTYLSVNTPAQEALVHWLGRSEIFQREILARINDNYSFLKSQTSVMKACELLSSEGGWYSIIRIPTLRRDEHGWVMKLLTKYHVFVHPGYFFDFAEDGYIVVCLLTPVEQFREGMGRILSRIEQEEH